MLEEDGCVGDALEVVCKNHPSHTTLIRKLDDFSHVRDGGCNRQCTDRLPDCGHVCSRYALFLYSLMQQVGSSIFMLCVPHQFSCLGIDDIDKSLPGSYILCYVVSPRQLHFRVKAASRHHTQYYFSHVTSPIVAYFGQGFTWSSNLPLLSRITEFYLMHAGCAIQMTLGIWLPSVQRSACGCTSPVAMPAPRPAVKIAACAECSFQRSTFPAAMWPRKSSATG